MARSTVAVFLPHDEYVAISAPLSEAGYEPLEVGSPQDLKDLLARHEEIRLAVLDGENNFDQTLAMCALLHDQERKIPALVAVSTRAMDRMKLAAYADDRDEYFTRPYSPESLRWRVEAILIRSETMAESSRQPILQTRVKIPAAVEVRHGRTVILFNPKGGVGKTTIAINLAAILQLHKGQRVLLADCDIVTGHVASSLAMSNVVTVLEAWTEDFRTGNNRTFAEIASTHRSGVDVLVLSESPLHSSVLEPKRVGEALNAARRDYDWTIIDMHPNYGPLNQGIFDRADHILVPVTPDVPTIRAAIQFLHVAEELNVRDRVALVVNRCNSGVALSDVQRTIGLPAFGRIRSAGMLFVRASNEGLTAVEQFPNERVIGDLSNLADALLKAPSPTDVAPPVRAPGRFGPGRIVRAIASVFRRSPRGNDNGKRRPAQG